MPRYPDTTILVSLPLAGRQPFLKPVNNILAGSKALLTMGSGNGNHEINVPYSQLAYSMEDSDIIYLPSLPGFAGYLLQPALRLSPGVLVLHRKDRLTLGVLPDQADVGGHATTVIGPGLVNDELGGKGLLCNFYHDSPIPNQVPPGPVPARDGVPVMPFQAHAWVPARLQLRVLPVPERAQPFFSFWQAAGRSH